MLYSTLTRTNNSALLMNKETETMRKNVNPKSSPPLKIEDLCQATGLSPATIYKYLRMGILHSPLKEAPTQHYYNESHIQRINRILEMKKKDNLSLSEIQDIFKNQEVMTGPVDTDEDTKRLILSEAARIIAKQSFGDTKVSDITNALKIGKGTFYQYFKNKEELFLESIKRFPEVILPEEKWEAIRKEKEYFSRLHRRVLYMLEDIHQFLGLISIAKLALRGSDPNSSAKANDCFHTIMWPLEKELNRGIKNGECRNVDTKFLSFLTIFSVYSTAFFFSLCS